MSQQPDGPPWGPAPWPPYPQVVVTPHRCSTAHVVTAWVCTVLTVGYLLPWAVAATRNRSNTAAIALLNLFLGWSLVGWVVALVMALGTEPTPVVHVSYAGPPPYWSGPVPVAAPYVPPVIAPPVRDRGPEPTVVDPTGWAQTQPLPLDATGFAPYDPPPYGSGDDHRR